MKKWFNKYGLYLSVLILTSGLVYIFREKISKFSIDYYVNPFFSKIPDYNWGISAWVIAMSSVISFWMWKKEWHRIVLYIEKNTYIEVLVFEVESKITLY